MSHKKNFDRLRTLRQLDALRWETAKELGLADDNETLDGIVLQPGAAPQEHTPRALVEAGEEALAREGRRKAEANLKDRGGR